MASGKKMQANIVKIEGFEIPEPYRQMMLSLSCRCEFLEALADDARAELAAAKAKLSGAASFIVNPQGEVVDPNNSGSCCVEDQQNPGSCAST